MLVKTFSCLVALIKRNVSFWLPSCSPLGIPVKSPKILYSWIRKVPWDWFNSALLPMDSRAPSVFRCQSTLATLNLGTCTQQDVFYLVQAPWNWTSKPWNFSDTQWSRLSSPVLQRSNEGVWTVQSPPSVLSENTAWKLTLTTSCLTHDPVPVWWVATTDCWGRRCSWRPVKPVSDLLARERPVDCCPDSSLCSLCSLCHPHIPVELCGRNTSKKPP